MKKKAITMLLAACMITNTVCFTAMAEDTKKEETAAEETVQTEEEVTSEPAGDAAAEGENAQTEEAAEEPAAEEPVKFELIRLSTEEDLSKFVKLGDYKGMALEQQVQEISDKYVDTAIDYILSMNPEKLDENTPAELGMTAYISYTGKIDGEEFEGGSSTGYSLELGSHSFIEGFEEGIVGMVRGETKDLNLKFPDDYLSEDVAGKDVVFTVSVLDLYKTPELTDEWVEANNSDVKNVEEFRKFVTEQLEKEADNASASTVKWNAWDQIVADSEILEYPEGDIQMAKDSLDRMTAMTAEQMGVDLDTFLENQGYDKESYEALLTENAQQMVQQNLIVQAIIDAEEIDLTDETTQQLMDQLAANYYVSGMDELAQYYGNFEANSAIALMRVLEFVYDNAEISKTVLKDESVDIDADAPMPETEEEAGAEKEETKEESDAKENAG